MKKKTIVYLSGPITGVSDYEQRFNNEEKIVKEYFGKDVKLKIINPVKIGKKTAKRIFKRFKCKPMWKDYMKDCIKELLKARYIWMLPGWKNSEGARIENNLAFNLDIRSIELCGKAREEYERNIVQE